MKRQNFTITDVTKQQLMDLKKKTGLSQSDIVRRSVEIYWQQKLCKHQN